MDNDEVFLLMLRKNKIGFVYPHLKENFEMFTD